MVVALAPLLGAGASPSGGAGGRPAGAGAGPSAPVAHGAAIHDLHVSYGAAAVEGNTLVVRIRFFKDDLEAALARHTRQAGYTLRAAPEVDAQVMTYLQAHFTVAVDGRPLTATLAGSGEDELDREPVWWYAIHFEAPSTLVAFHVENTVLTEIFDDQTNIVKFVHFPDQKQKTYSFGRGEERFLIRF